MKKKILTLFLLTATIGGCGVGIVGGCGVSAAKRYEASAKLYTATTDGLTLLKEAKKFDPNEIAAIDIAVNNGYIYLEQWDQALDVNEPYVNAEKAFKLIMNSLIEAYMLPAQRIAGEVD